MIKIIWLILVCFVFLSSFAAAEEYEYVLQINFSRAGEKIAAELMALSVQREALTTYLDGNTVSISLKNGPTMLYSKSYLVKLEVHGIKIDENGQTIVDEKKADYLLVPMRLPYILDGDNIEIKTDAGTKTYTIAEFICNSNLKCDNGENHKTCPAECPATSDGKCIPVIDNFCDPDCEEGRDPDCAKEPVSKPIINESYSNATNKVPAIPKPETEKTSPAKINKVYIYALGILILLLLILFIAKKLRKPDSDTQFSDEPKP